MTKVRRAVGDFGERLAERHLAGQGLVVLDRNWRCAEGEVDLILRDGERVVVVEVKKARSLDEAAHRLGRRQMDRLCAAAQAFCEGEPRGSLTELRFDLALVDGMGRVRVLRDAFGENW